MTVSANIWQARAAMCELLALSFRYPEDKVLAEAIASGEWGEAADEIAGALGIDWTAAAAPGAAEAAALPDPDDIQKELRPEATRLFVGAPEAACSPYEGVWRAKAEGVQPLLFVNPHSMAVERFCKACGLGRPEGTNEPLDAVWTELELLEYLALRAAADAMDAAAEADVEAGGGRIRRGGRRSRARRRGGLGRFARRLSGGGLGRVHDRAREGVDAPVRRGLREGFPRAVLQAGRQPAWRLHQVASARLRASVSFEGVRSAGSLHFARGRLGADRLC